MLWVSRVSLEHLAWPVGRTLGFLILHLSLFLLLSGLSLGLSLFSRFLSLFTISLLTSLLLSLSTVSMSDSSADLLGLWFSHLESGQGLNMVHSKALSQLRCSPTSRFWNWSFYLPPPFSHFLFIIYPFLSVSDFLGVSFPHLPVSITLFPSLNIYFLS